MAVYSVGFATVAPLTAAPYATIHTGASFRCKILEIGLACNAATASSVQLMKPGNSPTATTSILGLAEDPAEGASTVNVDTAWSTAPTVSTNIYRKFTLPATIGAGVIWSWPSDKPLVIPVSTYLVLWNFGGSTASVLNGYAKWVE